MTPRRRCTRALCDLVGVALPDRADRHGLGRRARGSSSATAERRRPRHPRRGDDDLRPSCGAPSPRCKERTDKPVRREPARRRSPTSTDRVDLLIDEGVKVASFAQAPEAGADRQAQGRRRRRHPVDRRQAPRREGGRVGRRRRARAGRRGRRPHRRGADHAAAAAGRRRRRHPGDRRRRLLRRPRPGRRAGLRRGRHRHGHPLPAHQRQRRCPTR